MAASVDGCKRLADAGNELHVLETCRPGKEVPVALSVGRLDTPCPHSFDQFHGALNADFRLTPIEQTGRTIDRDPLPLADVEAIGLHLAVVSIETQVPPADHTGHTELARDH